MESINEFIDISLGVQLWGKWNYMINIWYQSMDSFILKNLCQVKQEKYMNKKKLNINLVYHLWLDLDQWRIDQVLLLSIGYLWKQLDHKKKVFKNESMKDMKWYVRYNDNWRRINKDSATMNHASEKSKRESWRQYTGCDGEGQVDVWIRCIKLAIKNHISLSVNLYWIKI
jgi:hypothetical protein